MMAYTLALMLAAAAPPAEDAPRDAAFYFAAPRGGDHLAALRDSQAFRTLKKSPAYRVAMDLIRRALEQSGLPADMLDRLFSDQKREADERDENDELLDLLLASAGREAFVYGGKGWADLAELFRRAAGQGFDAAAGKLDAAKFNWLDVPEAAAARGWAELLAGKEALRVPELVVGLRAADAKKAEAQVDRLEKELKPLLALDKRLAACLKRAGGVLTLRLDGSFVPWDELALPYAGREVADALVAHLSRQTLCVSVGVRDGYVLLAVGPEATTFRPVTHHRDDVVAVAHVSGAMRRAVLGAPDWDAVGKSLGKLVANNVGPMDRRAVEADLAGVLAEAKHLGRRQGAWSARVERTSAGLEAVARDRGDHAGRSEVAFFDRVGGAPLFAAATGVGDGPAAYGRASKHLRALARRAEAFAADQLDEDGRKAYDERTRLLWPALDRLDEAVAKHLSAGLGGEAAVAVGADWTSDRWHSSLPRTKRALPLFEPAFVLGVRDRASFTQAMRHGPAALAEAYDVLRAGKLADVKWREAKEVAKLRRLDLFAFPNVFANGGLDEQVEVTAAVGGRYAVLTPSRRQALGMQSPGEARLAAGPLRANRGRLLGGAVLDVPALMDVVLEWADVAPELVPGDGAVASAVRQVAANLRGVAEVARCIGQAQAATYREGGVAVTHWLLPLEDLGPSPEPPAR